MNYVLTTATTVLCDLATINPPRHREYTQTASSAPLSIRGRPVFTKDSNQGESIATDPALHRSTPRSQTPAAPCNSALSVTGGAATLLTVGGNPVVLETISGTTDRLGAPPGQLHAAAEQSPPTTR